jgi:uncharacterized linocin/CFP29 family protein
MNSANELGWDGSIWTDIHDTVVTEMGRVRSAQKVLPATDFETSPTEIPNDVIDFSDLSIREGQTKSFVEIFQEFTLTSAQAMNEAQGNTCRTLAQMAAKSIALAEDTVLFQGTTGKLPAGVRAERVESAGAGLLGEASPDDANDDDPLKVSVPIVVSRVASKRHGLLFGENVFTAVADGIAKLTAKAQAPKFALFLPVRVFADTFVASTEASLVTTADRIKPLVEGGFQETVSLPQDRGLLVALAGEPTRIYVGREATTEFVRKEGSKYFFRVVERIQFVARDARALVMLKFKFD